MSESLNSADEINIDSFFAPERAKIVDAKPKKDDTVAKESGEDSPDASDGTQENDLDLDLADDDEEVESDVDIDDDKIDEDEDDDGDVLDDTAKTTRKEYNDLVGLVQRQQREISELNQSLKELVTKADQEDLTSLFTGDDDNLMSEGQVKKILQKTLQNPKAKQEQRIGTDAEAEQFWANSQPDSQELTAFYLQNKSELDHELVAVPGIAAKVMALRNIKMSKKLKAEKSLARKLKKEVDRLKKGPIPETAGVRSPASSRKNTSQDPLANFFSSY